MTEALSLAKREALPLVVLALCAAAMATFLHVANETIIEGETRDFDLRVLNALRVPGQPHHPIGPAWMLEGLRDLSALGSLSVLCLIALITAGFAAVRRRYAAAISIVAALGTGMAVCQGLKSLFERARPPEIYREIEVVNTSFPSGHAMLSAVAYLTLAALLAHTLPQKRQQTYVLSVAVLLTVIVGFSRIYLGVHWTTDVLAGWSVGAAWACFCWLVAFVWERLTDHRLSAPGSGKTGQDYPNATMAPTKAR
ncbi:MAG: phosphatase PAP2 family protein [Proteobacteria bacterium]|nr:phosphatase PAP2 family protein [Pseudomonadota bacterium]